jgi:hypothetical protein
MKKLAIGLLIVLGISHSLEGFPGKPQNVLIYTKNGEGYVHENIDASVKALEKICAAEGILTEVSDQPSVFTRENLDRFDAVIFSNSNNEGLGLALVLGHGGREVHPSCSSPGVRCAGDRYSSPLNVASACQVDR